MSVMVNLVRAYIECYIVNRAGGSPTTMFITSPMAKITFQTKWYKQKTRENSSSELTKKRKKKKTNFYIGVEER